MGIVPKVRTLYWVGSSKRDLMRLPDAVIDVFGYTFYLAKSGGSMIQAKPLKGFGSAGVVEVVDEQEGNASRAVYTVRFAKRVFVLHVFQKKSKRGISTPKEELDLIRDRLNKAEQIANELGS
jgi:phage-related protein